MDTQQYVDRVTRLQSAYTWNEGMLVLAVQSKLRGNAKIWSDTQLVVHQRWCDFSADLIRNFPDVHSKADAHLEMVHSTRGMEESVTTYFHRMCALGRRGGVNEGTTVKYIRNRLRHPPLQNAIAGSHFENTLSLYTYLCRYLNNTR